MSFVPGHSVLCERSREWISLRLDGELSELAEKMLESHLARCAGCQEFESSAAAVALGLAAFLNLPSSGTLAAVPNISVANADNSDLQLQRGMRAALLRQESSELPPPGAQQM